MKITLFYIDKTGIKTRKEANYIAIREGKKRKANDVWYITPTVNYKFVEQYKNIESQIKLDLINGKHNRCWIYIIETGFDKSERETSIY